MLNFHGPMKPIRVSLFILILPGLILNACRPASPTAVSTPACAPSNTTTDKASGYPEIQATATSGTLWALLVVQDGNFHAGTKARIVWKMSDGRGDIKLMATHEDGTQVQPVWGPISRQARTDWNHPGQEWGTEYIFPKAGCWRILASRRLLGTDEVVTAEIAIEVEP